VRGLPAPGESGGAGRPRTAPSWKPPRASPSAASPPLRRRVAAPV